MKRVSMDVDNVSFKQRIALFHDTSVTASRAVSFSDEELKYDTFLASGVKSTNILVAGLAPTQLKARGFDSASKMKSFGFDALHFTNASFCNMMLLAYGRNDIIDSFLITPQDAVSFAGSQAVEILKISTKDLLERCIGFPSHSYAVLHQLAHSNSLKGVSASLILDAGLRLKTLSKLGYTVENIIRNTDASADQLLKMGFVLA